VIIHIFLKKDSTRGPLGPLLCCLTVHRLLASCPLPSLSSLLVCAFMDDFTLGGSEAVVVVVTVVTVVTEDVKRIYSECELFGLHINVDKCDLVCSPNFLSAPSLTDSEGWWSWCSSGDLARINGFSSFSDEHLSATGSYPFGWCLQKRPRTCRL